MTNFNDISSQRICIYIYINLKSKFRNKIFIEWRLNGRLKFQIPYFFRAKRKVKGLRCGSGQGCRISWVSWATSCRGTQARFSFLRSSHWLHSVSLSNPLKFTARSNNSGCKVSTFSEIFFANTKCIMIFSFNSANKIQKIFLFFLLFDKFNLFSFV